MMRKLSLVAAAVAVGAFVFGNVARAGDEVPAAPAAPAKADAPKVEAKPEATTAAKPETKTPSPILSVMFWLGHQVAPQMDCACPAKSPEAEKAWRDWFAGGANVPAAAIRDQLVADGWTADRFVGFFKEMAAKKGDCGSCKDGGKCADAKGGAADSKDGGACHGKGSGCGGECDGKCKGCPGCPNKDKKPAAEPAAPAAPAAPATPDAPKDAPAKP